MSYNEKQTSVIGTPWQMYSSSTLPGVLSKAGEDLVENIGLPDMIFSRSEVQAAEMRATLLEMRLEDMVCTLVCNTTYTGEGYIPGGSLWIEPVLYSQLNGRIAELREKCTGEFKVMMAYSEETSQMFWINDLELGVKPRLPKYDQKYDRKRKGYPTK